MFLRRQEIYSQVETPQRQILVFLILLQHMWPIAALFMCVLLHHTDQSRQGHLKLLSLSFWTSSSRLAGHQDSQAPKLIFTHKCTNTKLTTAAVESSLKSKSALNQVLRRTYCCIPGPIAPRSLMSKLIHSLPLMKSEKMHIPRQL